MIPSTGVKDATTASGSKPRSNTKKYRTLPAKSDKKKIEDHSRNNKSIMKQKNRVDSSISYKRTIINLNSNSVYKTCNKCLMSFNHDKCVVKSLKFVKKPPVNKVWRVKQVVQIVLWYLDLGCSKHMAGDRPQLRNFVKKFIGTVRFGNYHFGAIIGYEDYVIGDSVISRNGVVERRNRTLVEAARTMLIFSKALMFLWAEAVATACYTQNKSLIHTRHNKTPYELMHDKKPDLIFLCVFYALCYPTNNNEDLGKLRPTTDIGIFVGYAPNQKAGPTIENDPLAQVDNGHFLNVFAPELVLMSHHLGMSVQLNLHKLFTHTIISDKEHVHVENPLSSTRTLSSMKNLDAYTFSDHVFLNSLLSTPVIDLTPLNPVSSTIQEPNFTATTETTTTTTTLPPPPPPPQQQSTTDPALASRVSTLEMKMASKRTTRSSPATTTTTTTPVIDAKLKALIDQGVVDALATHDADRSRNGEDSHDSRTGVRRQAPLARECTYPDFMKCKPLYFKGTEGFVDLTRWFERIETVFRISNCTEENQIEFATCTLLGSALTWWNSHVKTVGHDVAYAMTWTNLKNKMTDKYCPRARLRSWRMFPEESDKIERYVGGLPDMIHESVMASKPKTMQDAVEFATELMDKKICTFAECQTENKRKNEYAGTLPLCNECKFHHNGQCTVKCANYKIVGHLTRDYRSLAAINNQRNLTCYECGNQGHYQSDCPELKNRNYENQAKVDIEKVAVRSSLRSLKPKHTIEYRAKRSSINLIRTLFQFTCLSHNVKTRIIIRVLRIILVELALMCARMFPKESDKIERYIGGLPDMIHESVMASKPKTMQDAVEFATELMDKKICTFPECQIENKRKNEYAGTLPLCNECKFHHNGQCTVKCANYKIVGNLTRDYRSLAAINNQRNLTCYECGNQGHYQSDCPELMNRNYENQAKDPYSAATQFGGVTLELRDLPHKIDQTINEAVKEAVEVALQAPLRDHFRDLSEADMKEILRDRMFESGSYICQHEHVAIYEALEDSTDRSKERRSALSISKLKAANYPDFGLEELIPSLWIVSEREYDISASHVRSHMPILSVVSLKTISRYCYTYLKELVLRRADYKEYKILEFDFKNLHPSDFEDLYLLIFRASSTICLDPTKLTCSTQSTCGLGTLLSENMWKTYNSTLKAIRRSSTSHNRIGMPLIFSTKKITPCLQAKDRIEIGIIIKR
nr:reverse transcriptase domain-containing protein [Tanacetum cinerariifolium]